MKAQKKTLYFPHSVLCLSLEPLDIVCVHERPTSGTTSEYVPFAQHESTRGARRPLGVCVKGTQNVVPSSDARHADEVVARHVDDSLQYRNLLFVILSVVDQKEPLEYPEPVYQQRIASKGLHAAHSRVGTSRAF